MRDVVACLARRLSDTAVASLEPLGEGDFCAALLLNDRWVVRRAKHAEAARALAREACLLEKIGTRLPIPVPRPRLLSSMESDGMVLSIHALIEGEELTRERWLDLPGPTRSRTARQLGSFLRALHGIDRAGTDGCGLKVLRHDASFSELATRVRAAPLPRRIRAAAEARLGGSPLFALGWSGAPTLLNGDVSPGHVLIDGAERRLTGVIDWGDAALGDPARDLIFLYEDWGDDFLRLALEGYGVGGDPRFLARVHLHYLADQLCWTLDAAAKGRADDVEAGVDGLGRVLRDLDASGL